MNHGKVDNILFDDDIRILPLNSLLKYPHQLKFGWNKQKKCAKYCFKNLNNHEDVKHLAQLSTSCMKYFEKTGSVKNTKYSMDFIFTLGNFQILSKLMKNMKFATTLSISIGKTVSEEVKKFYLVGRIIRQLRKLTKIIIQFPKATIKNIDSFRNFYASLNKCYALREVDLRYETSNLVQNKIFSGLRDALRNLKNIEAFFLFPPFETQDYFGIFTNVLRLPLIKKVNLDSSYLIIDQIADFSALPISSLKNLHIDIGVDSFHELVIILLEHSNSLKSLTIRIQESFLRLKDLDYRNRFDRSFHFKDLKELKLMYFSENSEFIFLKELLDRIIINKLKYIDIYLQIPYQNYQENLESIMNLISINKELISIKLDFILEEYIEDNFEGEMKIKQKDNLKNRDIDTFSKLPNYFRDLCLVREFSFKFFFTESRMLDFQFNLIWKSILHMKNLEKLSLNFGRHQISEESISCFANDLRFFPNLVEFQLSSLENCFGQSLKHLIFVILEKKILRAFLSCLTPLSSEIMAILMTNKHICKFWKVILN